MKTSVFFAASAVLGLAVGCERVDLPAAEADPGGVSFDFAAISRARFAHVFDPARNSLKNPPPPGRTSREKSFVFQAPHTNGGVWRVSCRYKLRHEKPGNAKFLVTPGGYWSYVIPENAGEWGVLSETAKLPPGRREITVTFRLRGGPMSLDYKDFTLIDETPATPVVAAWTQSSLLDGTYAVPEGQPGILEFGWRTTVTCDFAPGRFTAKLELPPGIAYVDAVYADRRTVETQTAADGSSETTFKVSPGACKPIGQYAGWGLQATVVKAVRGPGDCGVGRLSFVYENGTEKFSFAPEPVRFRVVPAISSAHPKTYANGIMPNGNFGKMSPGATSLVASYLGACGVGWVVARAPLETYGLWRKAGVSRITPGIWPCTDGYNIRSSKRGEEVPASDRFVALGPDLKPLKGFENAVCPVTVYEGSDYFRNVTVPFIRGYLKGGDGCWSNWEPGSYKGKGCFCDRCCRAFAASLGKPYAEVRATWPKCVMKGGAYHAKIEKFRSREHAKVVHAVDRVVRDCTGGAASHGLIPAIAWIEMSSWWRPRDYAAEVQAIDYAGKLAWMCPWGPYAAWESAYPYVDARRKPLCQFLAAKDIRRTVDADYPAGRRPKLMALPQGQQCVHWLTQPENFGMALDAGFFNGFEATVGYFFPQGYDARYWERFADASKRAARYEPFVSGGARVDTDVTVRQDPAYAPPVRWPSGYLPDEKDVSPLQTVAWRKGDRTIVAVFNFWEKGEAFFDLKVAGLSGRVAVVDEAGVLRAADRSRPLYDAALLAVKGVRLVVPAARCRVFEFREDGVWQDATSVLTDDGLRRLYERRRGDLERAAEADAARENANGPVDRDPMPVI